MCLFSIDFDWSTYYAIGIQVANAIILVLFHIVAFTVVVLLLIPQGGYTMPSSLQQIRAISTVLFLMSSSEGCVSPEELKDTLSLLSADLSEAVDDIEKSLAKTA